MFNEKYQAKINNFDQAIAIYIPANFALNNSTQNETIALLKVDKTFKFCLYINRYKTTFHIDEIQKFIL